MRTLYHHLTLTRVIAAFGLFGFLTVCGFLAYVLARDLTVLQSHRQDGKLNALIVAVGNLVHETQKERGNSAGFLASKGQEFGPALAKQRETVDAALSALTEAQHIADPQDPRLRAALAQVQATLKSLTDLRQRVDSQSLLRAEAVQRYTATNDELIDLVSEIARAAGSPAAALDAANHSSFLAAKDLAGLERAVGAAGFTIASQRAGVFPADVLQRLVRLQAGQEALVAKFAAFAGSDLRNQLKKMQQSQEERRFLRLRTIAAAGDTDAVLAVSGPDFFAAATRRIDLLKSIEDASANHLLHLMDSEITTVQNTIRKKAGVLCVLGLIFAAISVAVLLPASRQVSNTIDRVRTLAQGDLESPVPENTLADLAQISEALQTFRAAEMDRRETAAREEALQLSSADGIKRVVGDVNNFDFSTRLRLRDLKGASLVLGNGLNEVLRTTEKVVNAQQERDAQAREEAEKVSSAQATAARDLSRLVEACSRGDFTQRISLDGKEGVFLDLCRGVNQIAETAENGLEQIERSLAAVATGDLSHRMSDDFEGAYGKIRTALDTTLAQLDTLLTGIASQSALVGGATDDIRTAMADLSNRTDLQGEAVTQSAETAERLSTLAERTASGMESSKKLAERLSTDAKAGGQISAEATAAIDGIEAASEEMAKIVGVIDEIAFQTNLLALNASVEAARAGEAGKGFSVVASEVRSLAGRCSEASRQIGDLIRKNVSEVRSSSDKVRNSGEALKRIAVSVDEMATLFQTVSADARVQTSSISDMGAAMERIDGITRQNSELVRRNVTLTDRLADGGDGLARTVAAFKGSDPTQAGFDPTQGDPFRPANPSPFAA